MGLSKKWKHQLAQITAHAAESIGSRYIDQKNQRKKIFLRELREDEDFWDEHEDPQSDSSSDESNYDESSLSERSSDEEKPEVDDGRRDNTGNLELTKLEIYFWQPLILHHIAHNPKTDFVRQYVLQL